MRLVIDSDAFLCLRKYRLIGPLAECGWAPLILMGFAARNELSSVQQEIAGLEKRGEAVVKAVLVRTPEHATFRALVKARVHKGEAEAIAWITHQDDDDGYLFVSNDSGARRAAERDGINATDVMGAIAASCALKGFDSGTARDALQEWNDQSRGLGRPADFAGFDETLARRSRQLGL